MFITATSRVSHWYIIIAQLVCEQALLCNVCEYTLVMEGSAK